MPQLIRSTRTPLLLLATLLLGVAPVSALLNIDGTRNQIFVFGGVTFGYSSNIFSERDGRGDSTVTAQAGADWKRRAGIIAVDSTLKFDFLRYREFNDQSTVNPSFTISFIKAEGRTTGSFKLAAYRESRADSAVNLRTNPWNYPVSLTLRYPLSQKFYITSDTGYLHRSYGNVQGLVDYTDFTQGVDLYYVYTSKLDLFAGYRIRLATTSLDQNSQDHWFNVGATGGLFSKLTGNVRVGYQIRKLSKAGSGQFEQLNASAGVSWPITRKLMLRLQAARDFSTIATGASVDTTSVALNADYTLNRKIFLNAGASGGRNKFLNDVADRHDTFFGWDTGIRYQMNEHFQMGASFSYVKNWSSLNYADFDNKGFSLDISTRY